MTEEEKQIIRDSCCITDEQRKEWNKKIVEISNFGTPYYTDEPRYERKNGQWVDTKADTIAELEKVKAEILEHNRRYLSDDNAGLERAIWEFIEPHIAELKGE